MTTCKLPLFGLLTLLLISCNNNTNQKNTPAENQKLDSSEHAENKVVGNNDTLPMPDTTRSVTKRSDVIGWQNGKMPAAPQGFTVTKFASELDHPRWIYIGANGDVFVSQGDTKNSPDNILLFRDANNDGIVESKYVFLKGLNMPFGMLILGNKFYVGNTDGVVVYDYKPGATSITSAGKKILTVPGGPRHWTRNIIASNSGNKIYVGVGSSTNVAEKGIDKENKRACIIEYNADGTGEKIYASGLRNAVGMDWAPGTGRLWAAVNERDELGDDVPPDYLAEVKEGGFYGWPYAYFGQHEDPRWKGQRPDLVKKSLPPDVILGPHTASLGLVFYTKNAFPQKYQGGAFVGQHGSWNRSKFSGYKVVFVPFSGGKPTGKPEDFLTGFIANEEKSEVYGRPVGVAVTNDGALLVADDGGKIIWRISYTQK